MNPHDQHSDPGDPLKVPAPAVEAAPIFGDDLEQYESFGLWMNVQLSQLVARWNHLAAPRAASHVQFQVGTRFAKPRKAK